MNQFEVMDFVLTEKRNGNWLIVVTLPSPIIYCIIMIINPNIILPRLLFHRIIKMSTSSIFKKEINPRLRNERSKRGTKSNPWKLVKSHGNNKYYWSPLFLFHTNTWTIQYIYVYAIMHATIKIICKAAQLVLEGLSCNNGQRSILIIAV